MPLWKFQSCPKPLREIPGFENQQCPPARRRADRAKRGWVVTRNRAAGALLIETGGIRGRLSNKERACGAVPWYHPGREDAATPPASRRGIDRPHFSWLSDHAGLRYIGG